MSVKDEFSKTINAIQDILDKNNMSPREIRNSIKLLVSSYQSKEVINTAYQNYSDSGVIQWKSFLRAARVSKEESAQSYSDRIKVNLDHMRKFSAIHLRP